ncbi:16S rRNA (guanine(527)-N(7))-methyltransferase RsmG [Thalassococcus sp. BH17M4-6]|uniref:16S rRNA (guanine(527)-N(7))-methyltransferase RsmG n=1 Tax=Thalassococcus sp. BH17M4-6 TaxID=3413148 RepID=UPI003BE55D15
MADQPTVDEMDVSRETLERLETYAELLKQWNPAINLVSKSTLTSLWTRHIIDSLQIFQLLPTPAGHWVDLGSGGGFPGVVVAICALDSAPDLKVTLVESDQRKCTFLRTVLRETGANAAVHAKRIEALPSLNADILSARALADLPALLTHTDRHMCKTGIALFPKGATWKKELDSAQSTWRFNVITHKSKTDENSVVLQISELSHV